MNIDAPYLFFVVAIVLMVIVLAVFAVKYDEHHSHTIDK